MFSRLIVWQRKAPSSRVSRPRGTLYYLLLNLYHCATCGKESRGGSIRFCDRWTRIRDGGAFGGLTERPPGAPRLGASFFVSVSERSLRPTKRRARLTKIRGARQRVIGARGTERPEPIKRRLSPELGPLDGRRDSARKGMLLNGTALPR